MGIKADRTVTQYGIGAKAFIVIEGSNAADVVARMRVHLYNDTNDLNSSQWLDLILTPAQKQALVTLAQARLQELETETGWTRYEPESGIGE